jgi:hypothetical protein
MNNNQEEFEKKDRNQQEVQKPIELVEPIQKPVETIELETPKISPIKIDKKQIVKDAAKNISGPTLNRIGCGVIAGITVGYLLHTIALEYYVVGFASGLVLITIGSFLEFIVKGNKW